MNEKPDIRRTQLAAIHVIRTQLVMDDETYRGMLRELTGSVSAGQLSDAERGRVLDHLKRLKRAATKASDRAAYPGRPHNIEITPQLQKIEAFLAEAGRPWSYATALSRRICKKDRLEFCTPAELGKLIAALDYDAKRKGRRT